RTEASVEAAVQNLERANSVVGSKPLMENIATLIDPPCSQLSEPAWIVNIMTASGCDLLLDLHNLYANSINFGFDPLQFLSSLPLARIRGVHCGGGQWVGAREGRKSLPFNDLLQDGSEPVYELLRELAARAPTPLTVILERDGAYPPIPTLLQELQCARDALA